MKNAKSVAFVLMLLVSAGVMAEGGKQRGDVGQGNIVQDQIRVVNPPAQWSATSTQPVGVHVDSDGAPEAVIDEEAEIDEEVETLF